MPSVLDPLIAEATRYAHCTMKQSDCLAPIMMAATDQGIILFSPDIVIGSTHSIMKT